MIQGILNRLGLGDGSFNGETDLRRQHIRHAGTQAEVSLNGKTFGVRDWSFGGVFFETQPDARLFAGDRIELNLKFRLPHEIVDIRQIGQIVRTTRGGAAAAFPALSADVRRQFERVIDSLHLQGFVESQVAPAA